MFRRRVPVASVSAKRAFTPASITTRSAIPAAWHAISVEAKPLSCTVAHDLRKKRFLSKEAPALPLAGCTKGGSCSCTYKHHQDRRSKERRKAGGGVAASAKPEGSERSSERRSARGRRSDD